LITAGVDVGSVATKVVLVRDGEDVLARNLRATGPACDRTAAAAFEHALAEANLRRADVARVVSTGYGRRRIDFGDRAVTEISACARGISGAMRRKSGSHLVIDLGGQDTKVILLGEDGLVEDFVMNDRCSAGTGRFLEVMAQSLQVELAELGRLSESSTEPVRINSTCTVFAESEVISLLSEGRKVEDIVAGLHASIAERIAAMAAGMGERGEVIFCGGGAKNEGMRKALADRLNADVIVPDEPQFVNALGAALLAGEG